MTFSFFNRLTTVFSGLPKSSSVTKFNLTRSSQRISMGIEQHVALHVLQLPLVYFVQVVGSSLSAFGVAVAKG